VRNRNRLEGCIVKCYINEEVDKFCNEYLSNVEATGFPKTMCDRTDVTNNIGLNVVTVSRDLLCQTHILYNSDEVQPYINMSI